MKTLSGKTKPEVEKDSESDAIVEKEILDVLPDRPDFYPINATDFSKIIEKHGARKFFLALFSLRDKGKIEINYVAKGERVFKGAKIMPEPKKHRYTDQRNAE